MMKGIVFYALYKSTQLEIEANEVNNEFKPLAANKIEVNSPYRNNRNFAQFFQSKGEALKSLDIKTLLQTIGILSTISVSISIYILNKNIKQNLPFKGLNSLS